MNVRGRCRLSMTALGLWVALSACGHKEARRLTAASKSLGKAVAKSDADAVRKAVVPGASAGTDVASMLGGTAKKTWHKRLTKPREVTPQATVFVAPGRTVAVVWTGKGWRFAADPTDVYAQDTPRRALEALVGASRAARWDVMLRLAPQRYRTGLSVADLHKAWTEGEQAAALRAARDRLADHLAAPIIADSHEASLALPQGHVARLEREGDRWVVVDF